MATGNQTITTAAKHIDEIWVDGVLRAAEFELVIVPTIDRSWEPNYQHGDVFHKVRIPNIETQTKSASTALDAYVYTDTEQTITINKHDACAIKHESIAQLLSKNDVKSEMQRSMGYSLSRTLETNVSALFASFSQVYGTLGVELTFDSLLSGSQALREAGYDMHNDVVWMLSTAQGVALQKIDTFTNAQYVGEAAAIASHKNATIGQFLGAPVIESNLITSPASGQHESALYNRALIALIMAQDPSSHVDYIGLELADVVVMDQIYGYGEVDRYSETPGNITATDTGAVLLRGV